VHTHTPKAGTIGMIAAKMANVPLRLHTVAGLPLLEEVGFKRGLLNLVEKLTYYCATNIYPNSFVLSEIIKQNKFCSSNKLKVIANGSSNGINTEYFNPNLFSNNDIIELKSKLNIKSNDFVFIYVGRLVSHKGINELVKAFVYLQNINIISKLLLVGDYETKLDPLEYDTIKIIENDPNIISVGYQKDVRPFFAISNCLVFPSYREGFPNVVMQAAAMGLPCIVSNINGCNEIIQEGLNGVIIPLKDVKSIAEKMKKISQDTFFYKKIRKESRKIIIEKYEQLLVWKTLLLEYQNLMKAI
jgi:glycosyltransferase involved in cell wall biosynthesis